MTYNRSPLNITAAILLLAQLGYGYIKYEQLMANEAEGMATLIAMFLLTLMALLVDFSLQIFLRNRWLLVRIEGVLSVFLIIKFITVLI